MGQEPAEPARILRLSLGHIAHTQLEIFAIGVDRANHHLVAEHELQVDPIRRDLDCAVAAGDTGSTKTPFLLRPCMLSKTMGEKPVASKMRSNGP